jgi:hypothetical protein
MSSSAPTTTVPPVTSAGTAPAASGTFSSATLTAPLAPSAVLTPEEMSSAIRDLTQAVAGIRAILMSPYGPQPPVSFAPAPPPPPPTTQGPAPTTQGVPITQIRFPSLPSPLPDWLAASVYTTASGQPTVLQPPASSAAFPFSGLAGYAAPQAGVDEHLFQGGPLMPTYSAPASSPLRHEGAYNVAPPREQPPRFTKLEFATYDGTVDP